jgi:hypothetical protein
MALFHFTRGAPHETFPETGEDASSFDFRAMDRWLECGYHIDMVPGRHFLFLFNRVHIDMVP